MQSYSLRHLSDQTLLRDLAALVAQDRSNTAVLLAHIAEVDARRLYLPAAYPSMHAYCVHELRLAEEAAFKRIHAARAARQFPALFTAVAEGRLHLTAVILLAPHLTPENADELLSVAAHQTKGEIQRLLAGRFPQPELPTRVRAIPPAPALPSEPLAAGPVDQHAPERVTAGASPRVTPLAPQRFALQLTMGQQMHDDLRYAQELLGHQIPGGDVTEVIHRALKALIGQLEKQKFAATTRPRPGRPTTGVRHVPAAVKRAVWERDGGQCTFVSAAGRRCPARARLEFDHLDEVARGGRASVAGIRLRCRPHNQYGAECTFGTEFMRHKREEARHARPAPPTHFEEVIPYLRSLGYRADEARSAAALCAAMREASLEQRVRHALTYFRLRTTSPSPGSSVDGKSALMPGDRGSVPSVNNVLGLHS